MLSKFLNSLPSSSNHNTNSTDKTGKIEESSPLYYEQMNDALIAEAQEKLLLEGGKLAELTLSSSCEAAEGAEEGDTFPEDHSHLRPAHHLLLDQTDRQSVAHSTASTFSPAEVKQRLAREGAKRAQRERSRFHPKAVKGDANAARRRKQNDQALANEDLAGYLHGGGGGGGW